MTGREFSSAIKHLPRSGPVRSRLPNGETLRLWSRGDDWVSNQVFWRGWAAYEPETTPLFFRLAQEADVVLDVGAYVGFYSLLAGLANRQSRVFAFEPMPDNAERLRGHLELNRLANVQPVQAAVSDTEGSAEIFHVGSGYECSTSLSRDFMSPHPEVRTSTVPTVALDSFLGERGVGPVSLLKIDVETAEPNVLRGMKSILEHDHPTIICEVLSTEVGKHVQELLAPLDYRFYHLIADGPRECEVVAAHPEWLNYLFTVMPRERLAALSHEMEKGS